MNRHAISRRLTRWAAAGLVVVLGLFFIGRAAVELVTVHPGEPETYRQDWGGPTYLGVVFVHVLPAVLTVVIAVWFAKHRVSGARAPRD